MPSISQVIGKQKQQLSREHKVDELAALFLLLLVCDGYVMKKIDGGNVSLTVYKNLLQKSFVVKTEFDLVQPLGDWLCSLEKGVWE